MTFSNTGGPPPHLSQFWSLEQPGWRWWPLSVLKNQLVLVVTPPQIPRTSATLAVQALFTDLQFLDPILTQTGTEVVFDLCDIFEFFSTRLYM